MLLGTDVESAWTGLSSKTSYYAGIYDWKEDYFFVYSVCGADSNTGEVNHLDTITFSAPLYLYHTVNRVFKLEFEIVFMQVFQAD